MLLMIPIGVIDTTPSIKEYLDTLTQRRSRGPWYKFGMLRSWKGARRGSTTSKKEQLLQSHEPLLQVLYLLYLYFLFVFYTCLHTIDILVYMHLYFCIQFFFLLVFVP